MFFKQKFFYQLCLAFVLAAGNIFCTLNSVECAEDHSDQEKYIVLRIVADKLNALNMNNLRATCKDLYTEPKGYLRAYNLACEELKRSVLKPVPIEEFSKIIDKDNKEKLAKQRWEFLQSNQLMVLFGAGMLCAVLTPIIAHALFKSKIAVFVKRKAVENTSKKAPKTLEKRIEQQYIEFDCLMMKWGAGIGACIGFALNFWISKKRPNAMT